MDGVGPQPRGVAPQGHPASLNSRVTGCLAVCVRAQGGPTRALAAERGKEFTVPVVVSCDDINFRYRFRRAAPRPATRGRSGRGSRARARAGHVRCRVRRGAGTHPGHRTRRVVSRHVAASHGPHGGRVDSVHGLRAALPRENPRAQPSRTLEDTALCAPGRAGRRRISSLQTALALVLGDRCWAGTRRALIRSTRIIPSCGPIHRSIA